MTGTDRVDFVVIGGGCAGLSLGVHYARASAGRGSMLVLEARSEYTNDRTFCSWEQDAHPFSAACTARWSRGKVRAGERVVEVDWGATPYAHLPADRFYDSAMRQIADASNVDVRLSARVLAVESERDGVVLTTEDGLIRARRAFDARPPRTLPSGALLQHFAGLHVRCRRPVFDPGAVTLMDFDSDVLDGVGFVYVLPFSPTEALVESTVFSTEPRSRAWHEARVHEWLLVQLGVGEFVEIRGESGILPMTTARLDRDEAGPVTPIGSRSGCLRPSTGYSFAANQRFCRDFAARLVDDPNASAPRTRPRYLDFLDEVLLQFLRRHPERGAEVFMDLFERVPTPSLIRFLTDRPRAGDVARVIAAMPAGAFLRRVPDATRALVRRGG